MAKQIIAKSNLNTNFKFDNTNNKVYTDFVPQVTLAELRSFTAIDVVHKPVVYIKDAGKQGVFKYDSTDTSTVDNEGITIKLTNTAHRYKRELTSEGIYASWFKLTSDTDDSYCIQRAVAYSLAQSEYPDVIITKGKWLVNNNATVLTPSVGKKIRIVGKGNPIIDFTCQSNTDSLTSAVFRTPVAWTYPSSWTVNRNTNYGTIEIEGITFDGNRNPANNGSNTVWSRPLLFMECEKVNVFNNRFQNIPGTALQVAVTSGGIISNNTFDKVYARNTVDNTGDSIAIVTYSENFVISDNVCKLYNGQAGRIGITVDDYCRECQVANNNIIGYERGIHIETSDNVIVKGNVIKKSPSAILFSQTTNCIADGNILDGSGIYANSQLANSALLFGLDDVNSIYRNNTIRNWSGVANTYLAKFFSVDAVIENNKFVNSAACQIWMYGNARQRNLLKDNVFTGAIDLILSVTDKSKVIGNKFYGGTFTADNTTDLQVHNNTFDVLSGSNTRTGLNLSGATRPSVLSNTFYNCSNYVIEQSATTNGLFENNTHIRTHASAVSNYFYVSSAINATGANINSTRNNFVRDFINDKTYTVGNRNPIIEVTGAVAGAVESYIPNRTITQLKSFTASDITNYPVVFITNNGKEGIFKYKSSYPYGIDDAIAIKPTGASGAYQRVYEGAVDGKWFGAVGDGVTDDTIAIQSALDNYYDVKLPEGTFSVSQLNLRSYNTLRGVGKSTVLACNTDFGKIINIDDSSNGNNNTLENIIVENMYLYGGGQTSDKFTGIKRAYGVYITKANNITINNLTISNCGVMNPADPKVDVNFGGYGILAEARYGDIRNIRITNIDVFRIAGGGMNMGDAIMINGFNNNIYIQPYNIVVDNIHIEHVGRHGISIGGDPPYSTSSHTSVTNIYVNQAALCGIDLEEASYCHLSNFHFENCGNSLTYFVPSTQYGADYNLLTGIAYGNLSHFNTFKDGYINNCQHGINVGGGTDNAFDNITIQSSVRKDMSLKLAQIGARTRFNNIKLLTTGKSINPFYNAVNNADLLFENSYFASTIEMGGLQDSIFRNCTFADAFNINNNDETKFLTFDKCKFFGTNYGFSIPNFSALENITWDGCLFEGCAYGISLVWNSIYKSKIINCYFKNCGVGVLHNNSDSQNAFDLISGNVFESCSTSLFFRQGLRECNIINNRFKNNSVWCIDFGTLFSANGVYGLRITDNVATPDCNYGIRLELGGGASSFDHCFIADNDFGRVAVTPYNIASDNVNGYYVPDRKVSFNTQAGLSYQLGKFDSYRTLLRSHSADGSVVIPNDATLNYPVGTPITIENTGDTLMDITGLSSVVIDVSLEFKATIRPKGKAVIIKKSANTWSLSGDLIPRVMKVTSDLTSNSATLADITNFTFPVKAGREYMIDVIVKFQTNAAITGVKLGCYLKNSGAGNIFGFLNGQVANTAASTDLTAAIINIGASNAASSFLLTTGVTPASSNHIMQGRLVFTCTTSGDIQFQWASEVTLSNAILVAGSRIFVKEI